MVLTELINPLITSTTWMTDPVRSWLPLHAGLRSVGGPDELINPLITSVAVAQLHRLSAALVSRKFAVARACVRGPSRQADVGAAG